MVTRSKGGGEAIGTVSMCWRGKAIPGATNALQARSGRGGKSCKGSSLPTCSRGGESRHGRSRRPCKFLEVVSACPAAPGNGFAKAWACSRMPRDSDRSCPPRGLVSGSPLRFPGQLARPRCKYLFLGSASVHTTGNPPGKTKAEKSVRWPARRFVNHHSSMWQVGRTHPLQSSLKPPFFPSRGCTNKRKSVAILDLTCSPPKRSQFPSSCAPRSPCPSLSVLVCLCSACFQVFPVPADPLSLSPSVKQRPSPLQNRRSMIFKMFFP